MPKRNNIKKIFNLFIFIFLVLGVVSGYWIYKNVWMKQIKNGGRYLYVRHTFTVNDIAGELVKMGCLDEEKKFILLAEKMDLENHINPGRYYLRKNATIREIIQLIKQKKEDLVELTIPSGFHSMREFIEWMDGRLEAGKDELEEVFDNEKNLWEDFGLMREEALGVLIPGKIKVSWAVSAMDFYFIFKKKFDEFWKKAEEKKILKNHPLERNHIIILASIVQCETGIPSEQRKIAGVYINRLRKNMLLQADPTVVFATGKWESQRLYEKDLQVNSPYNTYRYPGLPPGPILNPYLSSIQSVLEYEKHDYYYFCASPELNGFSNFSKTYEEHLRYARLYQQKLNSLEIH